MLRRNCVVYLIAANVVRWFPVACDVSKRKLGPGEQDFQDRLEFEEGVVVQIKDISKRGRGDW